MQLADIISLLGGVALFLFGMTLMGDGLKKVAGNQLELVLYRLSNTPLKGVLLGAGVTAVIQSSSATSIMVVGFVNSGMMKLEQAVTVIEGALIGTSITGWIICLSSISGSGWISLLSTSTLSAFIAIVGILLRMFTKSQQKHHIGDIMLGFSVLMYGMQAMSGSVAPLKESPAFIGLLTTFSHPVIGILVGTAFTAILQSASAACGILQALSMTGAVTFDVAYPVLLGIAVGAAVPVLLSALGAKLEGRQTAWMYLIFEIAAAVLCAVVYYAVNAAIPLGLSGMIMNPVSIALVNTVFRVFSVIVLVPFNKYLLLVSRTLIKPKAEEASANDAFARLEERFLIHPPLAVEQSRLTTNDMAKATKSNFLAALELMDNFSEAGYNKVEANENLIDAYEDKIGSYLMRLSAQELTTEQNEVATKVLHTLTDFERIADHAMNIADVAKEMYEKKAHFSEAAKKDLAVEIGAVKEIVELSFRSFTSNNIELAYHVEPLEERIDVLTDKIKLHHTDRLKRGECTLDLGFALNDLLTDLERISDHCSNLALAVIELGKDEIDPHDYVIQLKEKHSHNFDEYYAEYAERYNV